MKMCRTTYVHNISTMNFEIWYWWSSCSLQSEACKDLYNTGHLRGTNPVHIQGDSMKISVIHEESPGQLVSKMSIKIRWGRWWLKSWLYTGRCESEQNLRKKSLAHRWTGQKTEDMSQCTFIILDLWAMKMILWKWREEDTCCNQLSQSCVLSLKNLDTSCSVRAGSDIGARPCP